MKRELRGFLLGLLVAFLWVVLTAGIGGSEGKYQMVMGGSGGTTPVVLDTETGQVYAEDLNNGMDAMTEYVNAHARAAQDDLCRRISVIVDE